MKYIINIRILFKLWLKKKNSNSYENNKNTNTT